MQDADLITSSEANDSRMVLEDVWKRWKALLVETETFVFIELSPEHDAIASGIMADEAR
jgi:hypothetical protein